MTVVVTMLPIGLFLFIVAFAVVCAIADWIWEEFRDWLRDRRDP